MIVYTCIFNAIGEVLCVKRIPPLDDSEPNIDTIVKALSAKIDTYVEHKKCFDVADGYNLQYAVIDGICFLCCSKNLQHRICFMYLQRLSELITRFHITGNRCNDIDILTDETNKLMILYSDAAYVDKIESVKRNINEILEIMHNNIDKILNRGESLENLARRASDLTFDTTQFSRSAKEVRCKLCMNNIKMMVILITVGICVVLTILFVILFGLCYFNIVRC